MPVIRRFPAVRLLVLVALLALLVTAGQSSQAQFSYRREQTQLEITVSADAGVNPDDKGRAAPILVRIYELKSEGVFESADYSSLNTNDRSVVGSDLLVRDEFILRPGDVRKLRRKSHPDISAVGIVAGYRDLAQADWRAVQKIDLAPEAAWYRAVVPANKLKLRVDLQPKGIRLSPSQ